MLYPPCLCRYYLCAVEKKWHASCLKCAECGAELENEASCFEKEGQIYCRDDYQRSVALIFTMFRGGLLLVESAYQCLLLLLTDV